jgi:uncharacterized protein YdgA (DUF945 family)
LASKQLTIGIAVAAALAAGYTGSAWYFGRQIEAAHSEIDTKIAAIPYLKLVRHDYERSLFGATEVITLELPAALFNPPVKVAAVEEQSPDQEMEATPLEEEPAQEGAVEAAPAAAEVASAPAEEPAPTAAATPARPPIVITATTTIQHGPFPGFDALGAGKAETVIGFDAETQKKLDVAFNGKPAMSISTLYDFSGGGRARASSPPFRIESAATNGGAGRNVISGDGFEMLLTFTRGMERYEAQGSAPRFEILDDTGAKFALVGLQITGDSHRMLADEPMFYIGKQQLSLAELQVVPAQGTTAPGFALKDVKYDIDMPANGEFLDMIAKIGAGELRVGEKNYGPARYDFSMRHVNAKKLAVINREIMALYADPAAMQDPAQLMRAFEPLKGRMFDLLTDQPQFAIDRISFTTPDGEARLSAMLALNGAQAQDFANPLSLLGKVDFSADIAVPAGLAATLQSGAAAGDEEAMQAQKLAAEQSLDAFVQQGYAIKDGGMIKTRIVFRNKELLVNDKPFNPLGMIPARQ